VLIEVSLEVGTPLLWRYGTEAVKDALLCQTNEGLCQTSLVLPVIPIPVNQEVKHDPYRDSIHVNISASG
jgi:hypothetical protein